MSCRDKVGKHSLEVSRLTTEVTKYKEKSHQEQQCLPDGQPEWCQDHVKFARGEKIKINNKKRFPQELLLPIQSCEILSQIILSRADLPEWKIF